MSATRSRLGLLQNGWVQLTLGILCMALVTNLQYSWTLFVRPMHQATGWQEAGIQAAFTIFVVVETWLMPVEGWLVDRYGPRPVVAAGGLLIVAAWSINGLATSLPVLYIGSAVAGVGAGCVYGTCVGNAIKWFPKRRGFAAGLTATGYGVGAALSVTPIARSIVDHGYKATFIRFAFIIGLAIFTLALGLRSPPASAPRLVAVGHRDESERDYPPSEVIRKPVFWCLYLICTLVCAGGLLASAQIAPIAADFGVATFPVAFFGATMPLLTLTMTIDNVVNGLTRPLSGLLSDWIGRENTMLLVFTGEGLALAGLVLFGHSPHGFLIFAPMVFLCYAELYAIASAIAGDIFGSRNVTANAALLYTTKGLASLLVPLGSVVAMMTGSWTPIFLVCAIASFAMGLVAKFVLQPMRIAFVTAGNAPVSAGQKDPGLGAGRALSR